MIIFKLLVKICLLPVWIILVVMNLLVSLLVNVLSFAKGITGLVLTLLIIGTIICYKDWVQVAFLVVLSGVTFIVLFAGVTIEVIIETARKKVMRMILA